MEIFRPRGWAQTPMCMLLPQALVGAFEGRAHDRRTFPVASKVIVRPALREVDEDTARGTALDLGGGLTLCRSPPSAERSSRAGMDRYK